MTLFVDKFLKIERTPQTVPKWPARETQGRRARGATTLLAPLGPAREVARSRVLELRRDCARY